MSGPVHGDFSADQAVMGADGARLLDLDAAAIGDPVDDLASFAAELELRVACGTLTPAAAREARDALTEGYRDARGPVAAGDPALPDATARSLLLRAADPFRTRTPGWAQAVERVITRVEALVEQADPARSRGRP